MTKELKEVFYWLVRDKEQFYRIGIEPTEVNEQVRAAQESMLKEYYDGVKFINTFPMPIGTDIDVYMGTGNRPAEYHGTVLGKYVTCKAIFALGTKRNTTQNQWEFLDSYHKGLFEAVSEAYRKKMESMNKKK